MYETQKLLLDGSMTVQVAFIIQRKKSEILCWLKKFIFKFYKLSNKLTEKGDHITYIESSSDANIYIYIYSLKILLMILIIM